MIMTLNILMLDVKNNFQSDIFHLDLAPDDFLLQKESSSQVDKLCSASEDSHHKFADDLAFLDDLVVDDPGQYDEELSVKELLGYANIAKLMVAQAIRDLSSKNISESRSARKWLFDDQYSKSADFPFEKCCDFISIGMQTLGYECELTPKLIRKKIQEASRAKTHITRALEANSTFDSREHPFEKDHELLTLFLPEHSHSFNGAQLYSLTDGNKINIGDTNITEQSIEMVQ